MTRKQMEQKNDSDKKKQWNTRVRQPYRRAAKVSAAVLGITQDDVVELAIRVLLGVENEQTKQFHKKAAAAWHSMGEPLPFNSPLAPLLHNAA